MVLPWNAASLTVCFACFNFCLANGFNSMAMAAGGKSEKRPITNPRFDPNGTEIELFSGMDAGQLEARLMPKGALSGTVFIANKTDKPLNVKVPSAVIAVPIHSQFGGAVGGLGGGGFGGGGLAGGGIGGQGGGQQALGGGFGGGLGGGGLGAGLGGGQAGGGGFFSIPPERTIAVKFHSVCLQHGRPEPTVSSRYRLMPVSRVTEDPVVQELLTAVGSGMIDPQTAQAAAWAVTNKMSWEQLAAKTVEHLGGQPSTPYFTQEQLFGAQRMLAQVVERAKGRPQETAGAATTPSRLAAVMANPPAIGDVIDFELPALGGGTAKLAKLTESGPVVVVLLRGYPGYQCPLCTKQFGDFMDHADDLKKAGAKVVFIYPGPSQKLQERAAEFVKGKDYPDHFQIVLDPEMKFAAAYGLRWNAAGETTYPSTFIVDRKRVVTFATVSKTHGGRAKAEDVLKGLARQ